MNYRLLLTGFLLAILSCDGPADEDRMSSAYYWTTTFQLSTQKRDFIRDHHVGRLYVRFFDVVLNESGRPQPNATIDFLDDVPESLSVVPTVYILNECMALKQDSLADRVVGRVMKMCQAHEIAQVEEVQIDCDWTRRTQDNYFAFLERVRSLLRAQGKQLSVTIRLHQLSMTPPPADRGVLMVYNTGDVTDAQCQNPILDIADVRPYLRRMDGYRLPMAAAYPVFAWDVLRRGGQFVGIQHFEGEWPTLPGDQLITYRPTADEVVTVKKAVEEACPGINRETILFDLSDQNLENYTKDDFNRIYR